MMDNSRKLKMTMVSASSVTGHSVSVTLNLQTEINSPALPEKQRKKDDFKSFNFPNKLWKIIESDYFKSVWWDDDGNIAVIDPQLFESEILQQEGSSKIFKMTTWGNFIDQLNKYGFARVQLEFERSPSLPEFLAEEEMAAAFEKLRFFQNSNFRRGQSDLLTLMKRKLKVRRALPNTSTSEDDRRDNPKRKKMIKSKQKEVCSQSNIIPETY